MVNKLVSLLVALKIVGGYPASIGNPKPKSQGRFVEDRRYPWRWEQTMKFNTSGSCTCLLSLHQCRHLYEEDVAQVFRFFQAPDTSFSYCVLLLCRPCGCAPHATLFQGAALTALRVRSSRLLELSIRFMPSEALTVTLPTTRLRYPANPVRQGFKMSNRTLSAAFVKRIVPHAFFQGPIQGPG
eukprot:6460670-Amphidinium_carterae.2